MFVKGMNFIPLTIIPLTIRFMGTEEDIHLVPKEPLKIARQFTARSDVERTKSRRDDPDSTVKGR